MKDFIVKMEVIKINKKRYLLEKDVLRAINKIDNIKIKKVRGLIYDKSEERR